ncbi:MAG TPA: AgmX/PglI C-terminal domain-containing protein [Polyangia bacterium]|nr:AgmX/PglI C-terminal domain-containing protein [Polyangia bacterium]
MRSVVIARPLRGAVAALTLAAMANAPAAVSASDAGPGPTAGAPEQSIAEQVQRHQGEIDACYRQVLDTHPGLAGQLVVHFTVTARGTVSQAVVKESTLRNREVDECVIASVERWRFVPPENAQDTHVSIPFDLRPQAAAEQIHPTPGLVARHVLERSAVGYSRQRGLVVFNRCWTPPSAAAPAPGGEGCVVVLSPLSAGRPTQEIPVFKPGEAPDDRSRRKKETAAWPRVLAQMKEGAFVELSRTDWPADSSDLLLPPMGLALHFGRHSLKVTRTGSRSDVIGQIKTTSTAQARPLAAFSNPAERVVVVAITDQMTDDRPPGGPEARTKAVTKPRATPSATAGPASATGTVTMFEVIDVLR